MQFRLRASGGPVSRLPKPTRRSKSSAQDASVGRCRRRRGFPAGCPCLTRRRRHYSTRHGPSQSQTWAMRQGLLALTIHGTSQRVPDFRHAHPVSRLKFIGLPSSLSWKPATSARRAVSCVAINATVTRELAIGNVFLERIRLRPSLSLVNRPVRAAACSRPSRLNLRPGRGRGDDESAEQRRCKHPAFHFR